MLNLRNASVDSKRRQLVIELNYRVNGSIARLLTFVTK